MAYISVSLPAPASNGAGAAVDVSALGALKTITVTKGGDGVLEPMVIVEVSNQASPTKWAPLATFAPDGDETIEVAARWMRARVQNFRGGNAPTVEVGGEDDGTDFATLVAPAGSGTGAGVDTSSLGTFKTVHVGGPFRGSISILISQDAGSTYQEAMSFLSGQSGMQSAVFAADYMKVRRDGVPEIDPGSPIVNVGACDIGSGGLAGISVDHDGAVVVAAATTLNFTNGFDVTATSATEAEIAASVPYVDLRFSPYNVVAGDTSAAAQNTAGINQAISDYTGTGARLVLPNGTIYVDRANGTDNWCIKFGSGVTDLELVGQGMFATSIAEYTAGDGGGSFTILLDQCERCAVHDVMVYQDTITNPDPIQDNHLIGVTNLGVGTTKDVRGWNIYFGKSIGDQLRFIGDTTAVEECEFHHFLMHGAGTVTSTPPNGRTGSRSGVAFQRNFSRISIHDFYIDGAQNSPFDMEPTGGASTMEYLDVFDGIIDNSLGSTGAAVSLGGVSAGQRVSFLTFRNVTVLEGTLNILSTDSCVIDNVLVRATAALASDPTNPLFFTRQINNDIQLLNITVERTGGSNGPCVDLENQGNRTTVANLRVKQGTTAMPITTDGISNLTMDGVTIQYDGTVPSGRDGMNLKAVIGNMDNLMVKNVRLTSSPGKMEAIIRIDTRTAMTANRIQIRDVNGAGSALYGIYYSATAGTIDTTPEMFGVNNGTDPVWTQRNAADAPVTTMFPIISGDRGDICAFVGEATPEGAVTAIPGCWCTFKNGDSTADYYKQTGVGNTGWIISLRQVFRYVADGLEANPFTVSLPATRPDTSYNVQCTMGGPAANAMKDARALVSTFTTTEFQVELSAAAQANDVFMFTVEQQS